MEGEESKSSEGQRWEGGGDPEYIGCFEVVNLKSFESQSCAVTGKDCVITTLINLKNDRSRDQHQTIPDSEGQKLSKGQINSFKTKR
ncbi:hypothetical protein VNO77_18163 [Canavalia gladiata]|uniref:Uncharacterized protein n=1 Tax=Canavalia gladiata TaxID=3824 RepID=A0AAN9QK25_CANGL